MNRKHRYIIHVDGDSFFVACELLSRPDLVGKPVVTGEERGIASAMSAEAKRLGVHRGMPVFKIRKLFPQVTILRSHYEIYAQYSQKMNAIARRFSDIVEEYSVDECFLDVTAKVRDFWHAKEIARQLKQTLKNELGLTFSVGLAPTKVLAKIASKHQKPDGLAAIHHASIDAFLSEVQIGDVWGIGWRMEKQFITRGVTTAIEFKMRPRSWVTNYFARPYHDLWRELHGESVLNVHTKHGELKSLQATRTFPKASNNKAYVFSHLSRNVEIACGRLRENGLLTNRVYLFLKDKNFKRSWAEVLLPSVSAYQGEMLPALSQAFDQLYKKNVMYRATGITCAQLVSNTSFQRELFHDVEDKKQVSEALDTIRQKYGEYSVVLASSLSAVCSFQLENKRKIVPRTKPFCIPFLGEVT